MTPEYLDLGPQQARGVIGAWGELAAPHGTELWVGEIAACWHSGQQGWTDRFGDAFWFRDARMESRSTHGTHTAVVI